VAVRSRGGALHLLGGLLLLYLLVPVAAFVVRAVGSPGELWGPELGAALAVSLETATISTFIIGLLGVPLAYLLARSRGRWTAVGGFAVQLPLALPPLASGIFLIYVVGPYTPLGRLFGGGLTDTRVGIVLAQTFVAAPFAVIASRSAFAALDPAIEDVAATLGYRPGSRFWRVALPAAASGVGAGLLLSWLRAFGEYGATVLLAYHPYSLPVFTYVEFTSTGLPSGWRLPWQSWSSPPWRAGCRTAAHGRGCPSQRRLGLVLGRVWPSTWTVSWAGSSSAPSTSSTPADWPSSARPGRARPSPCASSRGWRRAGAECCWTGSTSPSCRRSGARSATCPRTPPWCLTCRFGAR
jgi:ABC-type sulfate transport system permease component